MQRDPRMPADLEPDVREAVIDFLRDWLPPSAKRAYRQMIAHDEVGWMHDPHFRDGFIVRHALRGNGLDERTLHVSDLEPLWPELLRRAVIEQADAASAPTPQERRRRGS